MEDDGIFYGHLVHFTMFCYILWTFGIIWYILSRFVRRKIWQPWLGLYAKFAFF
jgi:hypothetical protein